MTDSADIAQREVATRLESVRSRIAAAARRSGRDPDEITLVLASKTQPASALKAAYQAGARDFGENYVQEASIKQRELSDLTIRWHFIGHLQTNKAKTAATMFDLIHSVDSARVAASLGAAKPRLRCLVEVNLAGERSKTGIAPGEVECLIDSSRDSVEVAGLMTIPPVGESRSRFAELRELRDRLAASTGLALSELSIGMTDDFEVAIEEGATIVRVGRAVFGQRIIGQRIR